MSHPMELIKELILRVDNSKYVDIIQLDFQKAFERISHERFFLKMATYDSIGKLKKKR